MKKVGFIILCIFYSIVLYAAPVLEDSIHLKKRIHLLHLMDQLQVKEDEGLMSGSFPSLRKYYFSSQYKNEDNIFFTSLILWNLGQFKTKMLPEEMVYLE